MATPITAGAGAPTSTHAAPTAGGGGGAGVDPEVSPSSSTLPTSLNMIPSYGYDSTSQKWITGTSSALGEEVGDKRVSSNTDPANLRISTMNILADCFPWMVKLAIDSDSRFPALVKEIIQLDATFLGLNEVTTTSLGLLLADPWIQRNYFVTEIVPQEYETTTATATEDGGKREKKSKPKKKAPKRIPKGEPGHLISPHGCVLLSKLPFAQCWEVPPYHGGPRSAIVGLFKVGTTSQGSEQQLLGVCSIHTLAYQSHENKKKREVQLQLATQMGHKAIDDYIAGVGGQQSPTSTIKKAGFVIMGDMNLHFVNEDKNVLDLDMVDAWAETRWNNKKGKVVPPESGGESVPVNVADPGWTFDAQENTMIPRYIPGEKRKMRLDRILISEGSHLAFKNQCEIWGNKPVDKKREVFLSDHYGLTVDMTVVPPAASSATETSTSEGMVAPCGPLYRAPEVSTILEGNSKLPLDDHNFSKIRFTLGLVPHTLWLGMRWLGKW